MIKMMDHLGLVERHAAFNVRCRLTYPIRTITAPSISLHLARCAEKTGVAGHVEHRLERDAPRIDVTTLLMQRFPDEHGCVGVEFRCQFGIGVCAKNRCGSCIWIDCGDL